MLQRILTEVILLCLIVNAIQVCGSPRRYLFEQQLRNRRYASCPSCRQDRPEAISSPWYGEHVYEQPSKKEYQEFEPGTYKPWNKNYPIQVTQLPSYNFDQYNRPTNSRETIHAAIPTATSGNVRHREIPFDLRKPEETVTPASPFPSYISPIESNHLKAEPDYSIGRTLQATPYLATNTYGMMDQQAALQADNNSPNYFQSLQADSALEKRNTKTFGTSNMYNEFGSRKPRLSFVYRADRSPEWSKDELLTDNQVPEKMYANRLALAQRRIANPVLPASEAPSELLVQQPRRDRSYDSMGLPGSNVVHVPEVKYNPYNLSPDLNILKLLETLRRQQLIYNQQKELRQDSSGSEGHVMKQGNDATREAASRSEGQKETDQVQGVVHQDSSPAQARTESSSTEVPVKADDLKMKQQVTERTTGASILKEEAAATRSAKLNGELVEDRQDEGSDQLEDSSGGKTEVIPEVASVETTTVSV